MVGYGGCRTDRGESKTSLATLGAADVHECAVLCAANSQCTGFEYFTKSRSADVSCQLQDFAVGGSSGSEDDKTVVCWSYAPANSAQSTAAPTSTTKPTTTPNTTSTTTCTCKDAWTTALDPGRTYSGCAVTPDDSKGWCYTDAECAGSFESTVVPGSFWTFCDIATTTENGTADE